MPRTAKQQADRLQLTIFLLRGLARSAALQSLPLPCPPTPVSPFRLARRPAFLSSNFPPGRRPAPTGRRAAHGCAPGGALLGDLKQ